MFQYDSSGRAGAGTHEKTTVSSFWTMLKNLAATSQVIFQKIFFKRKIRTFVAVRKTAAN